MSLTIPKALLPVLSSKYPHRPRLLFILRKHPEAGAEAFAKALRDWRRGWEFDVVFGSLVARGCRPADPAQPNHITREPAKEPLKRAFHQATNGTGGQEWQGVGFRKATDGWECCSVGGPVPSSIIQIYSDGS